MIVLEQCNFLLHPVCYDSMIQPRAKAKPSYNSKDIIPMPQRHAAKMLDQAMSLSLNA